MQARYAVLDGKQVMPVDDISHCNYLWVDKDKRVVKRTEIGEVLVSTVFLVINHGFSGQDLWFETMVFGGEHDGYVDRYTTWDEAEAGHQKAVELVNAVGAL